MTIDEAKQHPHFKPVDGMVRAALPDADDVTIAHHVCVILDREADYKVFEDVLRTYLSPEHEMLLSDTNGFGRVQ